MTVYTTPSWPLWLTEADVAGILDMETAIAAVYDVFRAQARGDVVPMHKTHVRWGSHTLHAIGAASPRDLLVATKTWAHTAGGAEPLLVLWDAETGGLQAVIEAFVLGQFRTAAVTGLATDFLAVPEARVLAMIGSGRQALPQVAAVAAVRQLDEVRVFSPTPEHRAALATSVEDQLAIGARPCDSVDEAASGADIVTLATRAVEPILTAAQVGEGVHVNAIGAITPERAEVAAGVVDRAELIVVDDVDAARELSSELKGREALTGLAELVASGAGRPAGADLTLFKALGTGAADLVLGARCLSAARGGGLGIRLPERKPAAARFGRGANASQGAAR